MTRRLLAAVLGGALLISAAPAGASGDEPPTAAFVGDSIGVQAVDEVATAVGRSRRVTDLLVGNGATMEWTVDDVDAMLDGDDDPAILLVLLGHADVNWRFSPAKLGRDLRAFLDVVTPRVGCVRWFDIRPRDTLYPNVNRGGPAWNRQLRRVAAEYPNVEVMHYSDWASQAPADVWHPDQLHLSQSGQNDVARMARQAADGCDPGTSSGPWWDVRDDFWSSRPIAWMHQAGVATGYENGTFRATLARLRPQVSRGQLVASLWRLAGAPEAGTPAPWSDVPPWLTGAMAWAHEHDLLSGFRNGTIRPNRPMTRGQLTRLLWRQAGSPEADGPAPWSDVPPWLTGAMAWAHETSLLNGYADGTIRPDLAVERGQWAHIMAPADQRGRLAPVPPPPPGSPPERSEVDVPGEPTLVAPTD